MLNDCLLNLLLILKETSFALFFLFLGWNSNFLYGLHMCLQPVSHLKIASGNSAFLLIFFPSQDIFYVIPICAGNFQISISLTATKPREEIAEKKVCHKTCSTSLPTRAFAEQCLLVEQNGKIQKINREIMGKGKHTEVLHDHESNSSQMLKSW